MTTATGMKGLTAWLLSYVEGSSSKFYNVYAFDDGSLVLHWGRIGTTGQTKVETYMPDEAQIIAKRQVYAKAGKGYKMTTDAFVTAVTLDTWDTTVRRNWGAHYVESAVKEALKENEFSQKQRLVTTHYDTFIEQTNQVLDAAAKGEDFDALLERWQRLSDAWRELHDKHDHAAAAVSMVQQVVSQRLMQG